MTAVRAFSAVRRGSREVGALAQLRDGELDPADAGLPAALAVAVPVVDPVRGTGTAGGAGQLLDLGRHQPLGGERQELADQVRVGALLDQLQQRHSLVGHRRRLRLGPRLRNPNLPKTGGDRLGPRPRAALRRRLRARPPTPRRGAHAAGRFPARTLRGAGGPRQAARVLHPLPEILRLLLCAILAGAADVTDAVLRGGENPAALRRFLPWRHGAARACPRLGQITPWGLTRRPR